MRSYDHLERYEHDEVEGIDVGLVHVFPKLDGTNARVGFSDSGEFVVGSRRREITPEDDNAGFAAWAYERTMLFHDVIEAVARLRSIDYSKVTIYGEWMVPHTLKTYREDVWRQLWVFDVHDGEGYLSYEEYEGIVREHDLHVVPLLCTITNPTPDQLRAQVETNTALMADGGGFGEGVVVKNYAWRNKYGNQPWAKIVRAEFKDTHARIFGVPNKTGARQVEAEIAKAAVTPTLVQKERAKIEVAMNVDRRGPDRRILIPRLLESVFHCVVTEELWINLKKLKFPPVDFKRLRTFTNALTKEYASDLF